MGINLGFLLGFNVGFNAKIHPIVQKGFLRWADQSAKNGVVGEIDFLGGLSKSALFVLGKRLISYKDREI